MKAVIVAGGRGERLKPITNFIPKPMVGIKGQPILLHTINLLKRYGITDFIIALCYLPNEIVNFFGDGSKFGVKIVYTYEDPQKPLGTAGAISLVRNHIDSTFIVTYADILRDLNVRKMINFHKENQAFATINVYRKVAKDAKSKVSIKDQRVIEFIERPDGNNLRDEYILVNGSFYIFEPEIFEFIPINKEVDFGKDIFPKMILNKNIYAFETTGYFVDIGNLEKLEYARKTFQGY